jgi:hypothetical protein
MVPFFGPGVHIALSLSISLFNRGGVYHNKTHASRGLTQHGHSNIWRDLYMHDAISGNSVILLCQHPCPLVPSQYPVIFNPLPCLPPPYRTSPLFAQTAICAHHAINQSINGSPSRRCMHVMVPRFQSDHTCIPRPTPYHPHRQKDDRCSGQISGAGQKNP